MNDGTIATEEITDADLLTQFIKAAQGDLHTAMPCQVTAYDASKQTVDVVPALNRAVPDGAGNFVPESLPKLGDVPVAFQRCQQFLIAFPIAVGDKGLLIFCERNIGAWRATGNQGDPGDLGMHTLDGAVFIPGLFDDALPAKKADGTNMTIGSDTADESRIEIKPSGGGNLGAGASKGIARNGDSISQPNSSITVATVSGTPVVTGVTINGVALSAVPADPGGKVSSGSTKWKCVD